MMHLEQGRNSNSQLSTSFSAPIAAIEPKDHDQFIRVPVNELIMILRIYVRVGRIGADIAV